MSKFDSHMREVKAAGSDCAPPDKAGKKPMAKTEKGKFASPEASPDSVSQGIKRRLEGRFK